MQDLSPAMVRACQHKMAGIQNDLGFVCTLEYSASNASWLPYPDGYFDALFHFGGFNHFGDLKNAAAELTRVVRTGGRVLFGDEAVAPWLKGTEFDGIRYRSTILYSRRAFRSRLCRYQRGMSRFAG